MRLKNRYDGEVYYAKTNAPQADYGIRLFVTKNKDDTTGRTYFYDSIAAMRRDWEDAPEEPEGYWFIDAYVNILQYKITKHSGDEYTDMSEAYEKQRQIGNRFKTAEEAELAVEKLKAWKRLKDKGFRADQWGVYADGCLSVRIRFNKHSNISDDDKKDLDLLFRGEDE